MLKPLTQSLNLCYNIDIDKKKQILRNKIMGQAITKNELLETVKLNPCAIKSAPIMFLSDRDVMLEAVSHSGIMLSWASDELKSDKIVALAAVKNNGLALEYVSTTLRADKDIAMLAMAQNSQAWVFSGYRI